MIYFIRCGEFVKIGRSDNPAARARDLQTGIPYEVKLIGMIDGNDAEERRLHAAFEQFHARGEWFFLSKTIQVFISKHKVSAVAEKKPVRKVPQPEINKFDPSKADESLKEWINIAIQTQRNQSVLCSKVRSAFVDWCHATGNAPCNANSFGRQMTALGFKRKKKGGHFHYAGVALMQVGLKAVS